MPIFGCPKCFQGDPAAFWSTRPFKNLATLVDDSHFIIQIIACHACGQPALKVFTEFVDWANGDDAQYWSTFPLTADEAQSLAASGKPVDLPRLESISRGRPVLQVDYPTGKDQTIAWRIGPVAITPP